ncbi:His/Gly/Thr/Pro-type tRNA ligase C-terminal domain-containing protein [Humibacter sp.]|uniref:His/Gly/Thr/Pro-type tRNA ligase C-terminal domain-containing protein n=1 Tax=Humibacter sp. TaxID=1940291 RepID=UPI003F7D50CD
MRARLDARSTPGFGRRVVDWELKGVPVRIEVGPRDLDAQQATIARRDQPSKTVLPLDALRTAVPGILDAIQDELLEQGRRRLNANTVDVASIADAAAAAATGFARIPYATLGEHGEDQLAASAVTVRCLQTADGGVPVRDDELAELFAIVARSY